MGGLVSLVRRKRMDQGEEREDPAGKCKEESDMYPQKLSRRIFFSSHLTIGSMLCAGFFGLKDFCSLAGIVLMTSRLHWRRPKSKGWKRILDLVFVQVAAWYHFYRSPWCAQPYRSIVYALWSAAIVCYANAIRHGLRKDINRAAWFHALGLHGIGNFANCIFYYGVHELRLVA
eukprot:7361903-Pyramimonas_sp.AAC.1